MFFNIPDAPTSASGKERIETYANVRYEREADVLICHYYWDAGLTLTCDNRRGAGHNSFTSEERLLIQYGRTFWHFILINLPCDHIE